MRNPTLKYLCEFQRGVMFSENHLKFYDTGVDVGIVGGE